MAELPVVDITLFRSNLFCLFSYPANAKRICHELAYPLLEVSIIYKTVRFYCWSSIIIITLSWSGLTVASVLSALSVLSTLSVLSVWMSLSASS